VHNTDRLIKIHDVLLDHYGPQNWWPADSPFEVMIGAVLTQAAAWSNVEKALANLKDADALSSEAIRKMPLSDLAQLVYPSGYYNAKARKLKALCEFLDDRFGDDINRMAQVPTSEIRAELLGVYGIGDETADDIVLYALNHPIFVIDTYTRRLMYRLGIVDEGVSYSELQSMFMDDLIQNTRFYNEYHALIVRHAVVSCKKRPVCPDCPLLDICETGLSNIRVIPTP
jgi:endonuclease-3 related protein